MTQENFPFQVTPQNFREVGQALARIKRSLLYSNYSATTAPGVTNDVTEGYEVGSVWIDLTADQAYICTDATDGNANWALTASGSGVGSLAATYITQTPSGDLTAEQALSLLATGILKSTTGTGVVSIAAAGTDYSVPGHTHTLADITDEGTMAAQNANNVAITGGSITGITDLAVADGGTGASTPAQARINLGVVLMESRISLFSSGMPIAIL